MSLSSLHVIEAYAVITRLVSYAHCSKVLLSYKKFPAHLYSLLPKHWSSALKNMGEMYSLCVWKNILFSLRMELYPRVPVSLPYLDDCGVQLYGSSCQFFCHLTPHRHKTLRSLSMADRMSRHLHCTLMTALLDPTYCA